MSWVPQMEINDRGSTNDDNFGNILTRNVCTKFLVMLIFSVRSKFWYPITSSNFEP